VAASTWVRTGGSWHQVVDSPWVRVGGSWRHVSLGYVRSGGSWRPCYIRDTTGPASPTSATAVWQNGPSVLSWVNPSDSDFAGIRIDRIRGGTGDGAIAFVTSFGPSASASYVDSDIREDSTVYTYYLYPYDQLGNYGAPTVVQTMGFTGYPRGRVPSPLIIDPNATGTWRNAGWRTDVSNRPYQGYTSNGMNVGCYFWDATALRSLTGATISAATIEMYRVASGGAGGGIIPNMWLTQAAGLDPGTNPASSLAFNAAAGAVCRNGTCNAWQVWNIPTSWYGSLFSAQFVPNYTGVAMYDPDTVIQSFGTSANYGFFYGAGEVPGIVTPGRLTITHSG
jgi:hypothetical protein